MDSSKILSTLSNMSGTVGVLLQLGTELVPVGKALVSEIKKIGQSTDSITFQLLVTQDTEELDAIDQASNDDLAAINAELERMGLKTIQPTPPASPVSPT